MQYATEITTFSYKMRTLIRSLTMGIFKVFVIYRQLLFYSDTST